MQSHHVPEGGEVFGRGGIMQQAVVLEALTASFDTAEVLLEGYNGQLPKLDMYWLLQRYSSLLRQVAHKMNWWIG